MELVDRTWDSSRNIRYLHCNLHRDWVWSESPQVHVKMVMTRLWIGPYLSPLSVYLSLTNRTVSSSNETTRAELKTEECNKRNLPFEILNHSFFSFTKLKTRKLLGANAPENTRETITPLPTATETKS